MPLIPAPPAAPSRDTLPLRIDQELHTQLREYAEFLLQQPGASADAGNRIMHAELGVGDSIIFVSDGQGEGRPPAGGYALSLTAESDAEAERLFAALADGGRIDVPLMTTPFASRLGMTTDRFGTPWMVTTPQPAQS